MSPRVYGTRQSKDRVCACGAAFKSGHHARCRVCRFGGRDVYLASKKRARERRAEREGRVIVRQNGTRDEQAARKAAKPDSRTILLRKLLRSLEARVRKLGVEDEAARLGVMPSSVPFMRRYRSDPVFRERERLRTRDRMLWRKSAINAASDGSLTTAVLVTMFAKSRVCPYCRKTMKSEHKSLDHVVPLSRGGAHSVLNCVVCCKRCNARKHANHVSTVLPTGQTLPLITEVHR